MKIPAHFLSFFFVFLLSIAGCAKTFSTHIEAVADQSLTLREVQKAPRAHVGKTVIWGGVILSVENTDRGTTIQVLEKPLDGKQRPQNGDDSSGRFLVKSDEFLDPAIYAPQRELTVGGRLSEEQSRPLGKMIYHYPVVSMKEIHLWPPRKQESPVPPFYPPVYWYGPPWGYYGPLWYCR